MLDIQWIKDGEERALVWFKRGDQGLNGARNLQPVGYVLPSDWGYKPRIHEFNSKSYLLGYVNKTDLEWLRIAQEKDYNARPILDDNYNHSPYQIDPIDLTSNFNLKDYKPDNILLEDFNAIGSGTANYGDGETYTLRSAAYTDITTLSGNLTFNATSDTIETAQATYNDSIAGYNFTDNGNNHLSIYSLNNSAISIVPTGTAGIVAINNICFTRSGTTLSAARYFISMGSTIGHTFRISNIRIDGTNVTNCSCFSVTTAEPIVNIWNCIIKNVGYGIRYSTGALNADSYFENMIFDSCNLYAIYNNNIANTFRNCVFINSAGNNIYLTTNSTSINCATDKASVGCATNTSPVNNIVVASQYDNTDVFDLDVGYKLLTTGSIYNAGSEPAI